MISFWVPGIPRALSVGSSVRAGGRSFQVRRNTQWSTLVGLMGHRVKPTTPITGPVSFSVTFYLPRPARSTERFPLKRPDVDNLAHKLSDQFIGIFYVDDSQIVEWRAGKTFAEDGKPGAQITVEAL